MKNKSILQSDNWATPDYIYLPLHEEFRFDFDPCPINHDLDLWDGLDAEWGIRNFINPPYSKDLKSKFVYKSVSESRKHKLCVLLLPVSTSTYLFHEVIIPNISEPVRFYYKRIKFAGFNTFGEYVTNSAPMHDSMLVVFDGR